MSFRVYYHDQAIAILDYCDKHNIDYEIYDALHVFSWGAERVEIATDWSLLPEDLIKVVPNRAS